MVNPQRISNPFEADGDGLGVAAFVQWTTEHLIVIDEWCLIANTNFNSTNQFFLLPEEVDLFFKSSPARVG